MSFYLRPIGDVTLYWNWHPYADETPFAAPTGMEWVEGEPPEYAVIYHLKSPLESLEDIITQGQNAMAEAPLPADIQKQIFDLEVFVQNYYRRGAIQLILDTLNGFAIDPARTDVTTGQRQQVDALKAQMLAVFNGL